MSPNRSKISNGTIDGVKMTVPDDMAIRHRRMLAEWEAAGNTMVSYVPRAVDLMAYTAQKRWEKEVDGIEIGGIPVHTDVRSKTMIMGARIKSDRRRQLHHAMEGCGRQLVMRDAVTLIAISD
jgi:hypothetical protein